MAAGLGFIEFTTGDVLSAAAANGYLASQSVMVFATAAARTTAITSPQQGMISFLKDTNTTQFYTGAAWTNLDTAASPLTTKGDIYGFSTVNARLAVGANNTVLTADSTAATGLAWATATSGGMTLLSTTTLSGASTSISITPTSYNEILVIVSGVTNASNGNLFMGLNTDTTAGNYVQAFYGTEGTTYYSGANVGIAGVNAILPGTGGYLGANNANIAQFSIAQPNSVTRKVITGSSAFFSSSSLNAASNSTCNYVTTSALSSVQLKTTVGTFTAGTALVYGVK